MDFVGRIFLRGERRGCVILLNPLRFQCEDLI